MVKIMFVCHGNICRSTMAEFVLKDMVEKLGLSLKFEIASSGTSREEIGRGVHPKTQKKLKEVGVYCGEHRSVQLTKEDYSAYDLLVCMDLNNVKNTMDIIGRDEDSKVIRLLDLTSTPRDIKDPWYTGNYDETYEDLIIGCNALIAHLGYK
jgi:protein-tyrosine phosphatase